MNNYNYSEIQEHARYRLGIPELCALLDYDEDQFRKDLKSDVQLQKAWAKGRAEALRDAAEVVRTAQDGTMVGPGGLVTKHHELRLKAAIEFLERHSPDWRKGQ